jgi:hypothetical protein
MKFKTVIELGGKTATGFEVPEDVVDALKGGKKPAVVVTIKTHSYRTTIGSRNGRFLIPLSAENREAAGVVAGDNVTVDVTLDSTPRTVEIPDDFKKLLKKHGLLDTFEELAFSHRKEHVRAINDAKTQ